MRQVVVVIPCHHRVDLLRRAVASVGPHQVLVVDDSRVGLSDLPEGIVHLRTPGQVGFARSVNQGLAAAADLGAELALVLNDDAELEPGCLEGLCAHYRGGPVGPLIVGPRGVESAGIRLGRSGRLRQHTRVPRGTAVAVQALSGACLLLDARDRFDPRFPHGMEDIELCLRLARQGRGATLVPGVRCRHLGGASVGRDGERAQRGAVEGHLRLVGGGWRTPIVLGLAAAQVAREGGSPERFRGIWRGWRGWRRASAAR